MQNGQLHAESYEIHRKMSDKSERLLHLLLDQLPPVLREAAVSQTFNFLSFNVLIFKSSLSGGVFLFHCLYYSEGACLCLIHKNKRLLLDFPITIKNYENGFSLFQHQLLVFCKLINIKLRQFT